MHLRWSVVVETIQTSEADYNFSRMLGANEQVRPVPSGSISRADTTPSSITIAYLRRVKNALILVRIVCPIKEDEQLQKEGMNKFK